MFLLVHISEKLAPKYEFASQPDRQEIVDGIVQGRRFIKGTRRQYEVLDHKAACARTRSKLNRTVSPLPVPESLHHTYSSKTCLFSYFFTPAEALWNQLKEIKKKKKNEKGQTKQQEEEEEEKEEEEKM
jgi:hypothetical protein